MPRGLDFLNKYTEIVQIDPQQYYADYQKLQSQIAAAPIKHNGAAIGFIYNPLFYAQDELDCFTTTCKQLAKIMERVIEHYLENPDFRMHFNFSPELEKLILLEPGYSTYFPMARFDIFYDFATGELKFCELNADGSSGMTKSLLLDQCFVATEPVETLQKKYEISYLNPVDTWLETLYKNYAEFAGRKYGKLSVAIIDLDWEKQGMVTEFQEFKRRLETQGHSVVICDPRDLKYKTGKLYYQDQIIDLIYRRAVTSDLLEIYSEIQDLLTAIQEQAVCMVGSFRSQIIHNKQVFAILHQPDLVGFLTDEELEFIKRFIPYTAIFSKDLVDKVLAQPENWVLKPLDSYQSQGVYIGKDYSQTAWQEIIKTIPEKEYLLQEYIEVPKLSLLDYQQENLVESQFNQMIGLFLYNKELTGFYTRVSPLNNVASGLGAVAVANLIVNEKVKK